MRLIVTRPEADLAPLAEKLRARGHSCIASPLMAIQLRRDATIGERSFQAIALSSANAMTHPDLAPASPALATTKVFAVGTQSAKMARQAGYQDVQAEGGNVEGLARAIARECQPDGGPILYPSGAETAGDLKATLEAQGFTVHRVILYDAVPAAKLEPAAIAALKAGSADGVLLYSPRSARIWASLVAESGLTQAAQRIAHFCLSPNVAAALGAGFITEIAARPDEPSLLALLDRSP
jgi:uroporphyrinogen-III synthase